MLCAGLSDVEELVAHRSTICARTTVGEVYCWGRSYNHELIGHAEPFALTPVKLPFTAARSLAVGDSTACVIENEIVYCWGANRIDRPGQVRTAAVTVKVDSFLLNGIDELRANGERTCAHRTDNALICWGEGSLGQHGDGSRDDRAQGTEPHTDVRAFGLGYRHTCVARANGSVACWGEDDASQVNGTATPMMQPALSPRTVAGIGEPIVELAAGDAHTCARSTSNALWCWGNNSEGQLAGGPDPAPVTRSMFAASSRIAAGQNHMCALDQGTGAVMCAGRNNENQIDAMISDAAVPRQALPSASVISTLHNFNCALVGTDAMCWGDNTYGQLADGTYTNRAAPMVAMTGVIDVVAGARHVCTRMASGEVWCWGANDAGQLGDGTLISRIAPVRAPALDGVTQLALGDRHTCGLTSDGTVRCLGSDRRGALGDGGTLVPATPTPAAISCP